MFWPESEDHATPDAVQSEEERCAHLIKSKYMREVYPPIALSWGMGANDKQSAHEMNLLQWQSSHFTFPVCTEPNTTVFWGDGIAALCRTTTSYEDYTTHLIS